MSVSGASGGSQNAINCEECGIVPSILLCLPCSAHYCRQCHKDTHGTKVLKAHPNVNIPKLQYRVDVSTAGEDLLSTQDHFFGEVKLEGDAATVVAQLEETIRQQKIAVNVWDYGLEKIRDRLEASLGNVIQNIKSNSEKVAAQSVALKIRELTPVLKSNIVLMDTIATCEKALRDGEQALSSYKREDIMAASNLVEAAIQKSRDVSKTLVLNIESKLILEDAAKPATEAVAVVKTINPKAIVNVKLQSADHFEKAKECESKNEKALAFESMTKAASFFTFEAMAELARYYSEGYGCDKNSQFAVYWATKASYSPKANGDLFLFLAKEFINGLNDVASAKYWLLRGAEINHAACLGYLALKMDLPEEEASTWLSKAVNAGDASAQLYFGDRYVSSNSHTTAAQYYNSAALSGNEEAMFKLAQILEEPIQDYLGALKWYEKSAEKGNVTSMFKTGLYYEEGKADDINLKKALSFHLQAAEKGHPEAQCHAGLLLESRNVEEALKWFRLSANEGIAISQFKLGQFLKTREPEVAEGWLHKAAQQDHGQACLEFAKIKKEQKNYEEAAVFFGRASQQDIAEAYFELGMLYSSGLGVLENVAKAEECLTKSADLGFADARALQKSTMSATTKGNVKKLFAKLVSEMEMKKDASAILMPEPAIVAEMYKKSRHGKSSSQKRLFILHGPFFSYYKDSGDSYASYRMNLRAGKVERLYSKDTKSEFYFQVTAQFEDLECYSEDRAIVDKWVAAIERAILYYTYQDTKTVFAEVKTKPEEDDLPEENRFKSEMLNSIIKAGWLQKQGGKRKNWNKRWFVLVRDNLFYFKDEHTKSPEPEGGIPLEYCTVILNAKDTMDIPKKNALGVLTLYRNYYLQASSNEDMVSWANAIEAAADGCTARAAVNIDELRERSKLPPGSPRASSPVTGTTKHSRGKSGNFTIVNSPSSE
jgi:TPR repeat protein